MAATKISALTNATTVNLTDELPIVQGGITKRATVAEVESALTAFQPVAAVLTNTTAAFTTAQATKLSNIETAATADQTGTEIVTAINTELGGTTWQSGGGGGGASALNDLSDVVWTSPIAGDELIFDGSNVIKKTAAFLTVSASAIEATDTVLAFIVSNVAYMNQRLQASTEMGAAATILQEIQPPTDLPVGQSMSLLLRGGGPSGAWPAWDSGDPVVAGWYHSGGSSPTVPVSNSEAVRVTIVRISTGCFVTYTAPNSEPWI